MTTGVPIDLLAHWTYRRECLYRDLNKAKDTRRDAMRIPPLRRLSDFAADETYEPVQQDLSELNAEIDCLAYLYAEAEYTCLVLDLTFRYEHLASANAKLDEYLNRCAEWAETERVFPLKPKPLECSGTGTPVCAVEAGAALVVKHLGGH